MLSGLLLTNSQVPCSKYTIVVGYRVYKYIGALPSTDGRLFLLLVLVFISIDRNEESEYQMKGNRNNISF